MKLRFYSFGLLNQLLKQVKIYHEYAKLFAHE